MRNRPTGKIAVFKRYYFAICQRLSHVERNTPNDMAIVKTLDTKLSTLAGVLRDMGWVDEYRDWIAENDYELELVKKKRAIDDVLGTLDNPKQPFRYRDTDNFRKRSLSYYNEAIMNQGMSHEEFMERFMSVFSDVYEKWEHKNNKEAKEKAYMYYTLQILKYTRSHFGTDKEQENIMSHKVAVMNELFKRLGLLDEAQAYKNAYIARQEARDEEIERKRDYEEIMREDRASDSKTGRRWK